MAPGKTQYLSQLHMEPELSAAPTGVADSSSLSPETGTDTIFFGLGSLYCQMTTSLAVYIAAATGCNPLLV